MKVYVQNKNLGQRANWKSVGTTDWTTKYLDQVDQELK